MSYVDIIILVIVFVILGLIVYFSIWKKRKEPCKGCAYVRECDKTECAMIEKAVKEYKKSKE